MSKRMHACMASARSMDVKRRSKEKKGMQRALSAPTRKKQKELEEAEEAAGE